MGLDMKYALLFTLLCFFNSCGRSGTAQQKIDTIAPVLQGNWVLLDAADRSKERGSIAVGNEKISVMLPGLPGAVAQGSDLELDSVYGSGVIEVGSSSLFVRRVEADIFDAQHALVSPSLHVDLYSSVGHEKLILWPKSMHTLAVLRDVSQRERLAVQKPEKHSVQAARQVEHKREQTQQREEVVQLAAVETPVLHRKQAPTSPQLSNESFTIQVRESAPSFAPLVKRFVGLDREQRHYQFNRLGDAVRYGLMQKQLLAHRHGEPYLADAQKLLREWMAFQDNYRQWDRHL